METRAADRLQESAANQRPFTQWISVADGTKPSPGIGGSMIGESLLKIEDPRMSVINWERRAFVASDGPGSIC